MPYCILRHITRIGDDIIEMKPRTTSLMAVSRMTGVNTPAKELDSRLNLPLIACGIWVSHHVASMRRCLYEQCLMWASYNIESSKRPAYCKQHAEDGMVNVCKTLCSHDFCTKIPSFNVKGSKTAIYCKHCLLYTSPSPRDLSTSRMPSSA